LPLNLAGLDGFTFSGKFVIVLKALRFLKKSFEIRGPEVSTGWKACAANHGLPSRIIVKERGDYDR